MTENEIYDRMTPILQSLFLRKDLVATPDLAAKDVDGWDSFKQLELILAVEEEFGVKFPAMEIDRFEKIGDIINSIALKK